MHTGYYITHTAINRCFLHDIYLVTVFYPTGSMRANVRPGNYHEGMGSGSVNVYPQGDDSKGVGNALKAFVIDRGIGQRPNTKRSRGRTPNKTGDRFLTKKTAKRAEDVTVRAMEAEFDRIIEESNK